VCRTASCCSKVRLRRALVLSWMLTPSALCEQTRSRRPSTMTSLQALRMRAPPAHPSLMTATRQLPGLATERAAEKDGVDALLAFHFTRYSHAASAWHARRGSRLGVFARDHASRAHGRRQRALPRRAVFRQHPRHCGVAAAGVRGAVLNLALRPAIKDGVRCCRSSPIPGCTHHTMTGCSRNQYCEPLMMPRTQSSQSLSGSSEPSK
jgi:hypothetical protein